MARVFNFGAGPAVLPVEVLEEAQREMLDYKGSGMSILESSHRGKEYDAVHLEAIANLTKLFDLDDSYTILLLQGGASGQFAMLPMNLLTPGSVADYTLSGTWAKKAYSEAKIVGKVNVAADTQAITPARMPRESELKQTPGAAYLHITTNETIGGIQWKSIPKTAAPLVADMSSDVLSRPLDYRRFSMFYAGAQKNLGPSGLVVVGIRKELMARCPATVPVFLRYSTHAEENSLYNTPSTFSIYLLMLTTRWMLKQGVDVLYKRNADKAAKIYAAIDGSNGYFKGTTEKMDRSDMNVTFRLPTEALEEQFLKESSKAGMKALKGHRSVGGIRASIYNAFPMEGVDALVSFMKDFASRNA
jgi:phosphoserine aminotransferase